MQGYHERMTANRSEEIRVTTQDPQITSYRGRGQLSSRFSPAAPATGTVGTPGTPIGGTPRRWMLRVGHRLHGGLLVIAQGVDVSLPCTSAAVGGTESRLARRGHGQESSWLDAQSWRARAVRASHGCQLLGKVPLGAAAGGFRAEFVCHIVGLRFDWMLIWLLLRLKDLLTWWGY